MSGDLVIALGSLSVEFNAFNDEWDQDNYYNAGLFASKAMVSAAIAGRESLNLAGISI